MFNGVLVTYMRAADWFDRRHQVVWRMLVVTLVLTGAIWFGLSPSRMFQGWVLVGIPALIVALACVWSPPLGLMFAIVLGQMLPLSVATGTGTTFNPAVLLVLWLLVIWFLRMVVRREAGLSGYAPVQLAFLFMLEVLVAFAVGQIRWYPISGASLPAQIGGVIIYVVSLGAMLLAAHLIDDLIWLRRMTYAVLGIGALYLASLFLFWSFGGRYIEQLFIPGTLTSIFWIWLIALAAGEILFNPTLTLVRRVALIGLIGTTFYLRIMVGGEWASGWMPAVISLLGVVWGRYRRLGWFGIGLVVAAFIANFGGLLTAVSADSSGNLFPWEARNDAWRIVLTATSANPLFGLGPSNYYHYVRLFPLRGWQQQWYVNFSSHNNFVDIIGQFGYIGLVLFVLLVAALAREIWLLRDRVTDGFLQGYLYGALGALLGCMFAGMLGDWFLPFVYNIGMAGVRSSVIMWIFLGGVLAIRRHVERAEAGREAGESA